MNPGAPQTGTSGGALYMILREFHAKSGREKRFGQVYSPEGRLGKVFHTGEGLSRYGAWPRFAEEGPLPHRGLLDLTDRIRIFPRATSGRVSSAR